MRPPPPGWPRISSALCYRDPRAALEWLCRVFGFEQRLVVEGEDGQVLHSELEYGPDGLVMVGGVQGDFKSPLDLGGSTTHSLCVYLDDVDAHHARAVAQGARLFRELSTADYGDRTYGAIDLEGHRWYFVQRVDQQAWERATSKPA
jgi:uncharacterized glyoxalase superfamily protein PhnB